MSRISYFQRFSQPENHATNNTLLVFRYLYELSPARLQQLLTALLETELEVGLTFEQQVKMGPGIPDALIKQESLRLFFETKRGSYLDVDQIERHCKGIAAKGKRPGDVLVGLTKEPILESERNKLVAMAAEHGVAFVSATFSGIVEALKLQTADYERDFLALIDDYEAYLTEERLLDESGRKVFVNPCGTSFAENVKYSLYYEPSVRRLANNCRYLGIYRNKAVSYVGVIQAIAVATTDVDLRQTYLLEAGKLTDEHRERISEVIRETGYYDLADNPHRFYVADKLRPTNAIKTTPGGIRGRTYLDLKLICPLYNPTLDYTSEQAAALLQGIEWA